MAETSKSKKSDSKSKNTSSESKNSGTSDGSGSSTSSSTSSDGGGKSSRESVGGASAVHYGYFSNIKTREYKSGWDEIWGNNSKPKKKTAAKSTPRKPARNKEPLVLTMSLNDLPDQLQEDLADIARKKLKKSRISYDRRRKADAVTWRIECEVKR